MDNKLKTLVQSMIDRSIAKALGNLRHNITASVTAAREGSYRADADQAGESREVDFAFPPGIKGMPMIGDRLQISLNHDQSTATPGVDKCVGVHYEGQSGTEGYVDASDQVKKPLPAVNEGELVACAPGAPAEAKIYWDDNGNIWITGADGNTPNRKYYPNGPVNASNQKGCLFLVSPTEINASAPKIIAVASVEASVTAPDIKATATVKALVTSPKVVIVSDDMDFGADGLGADNGLVRKSDLAHALTTHTHPDAQGGSTGVGTDTSQASVKARCS